MDGVITTPDAEQFRDFKAGNEGALATIYRERYEAMLALAKDRLGSEIDYQAPRVVEQAMLSAWSQRDRFATPDELVAFLEGGVSELSQIQKRKHAALHRKGRTISRDHVVTPSVDDAVAQLLAALHAPVASHEELVAEANAAKKHHAAEHVQKVGKGRGWVGPALLIGSLAIVAVLGVRWMDANSRDIAVDKALKADDARSLSSTRGQRGTVTLNDESVARMGADTRLRMPRDFGGQFRTLELTGAAHFQVAPNREPTFRVRAGNVEVTAVGTTFAVRSYEGDSVVLVSVEEGTVQVALRNGDAKQDVAAGEAVRVVGNTITTMAGEARDAAMAWLRDSLVVQDMPVSEVLPELQRWFDLNPKLAADTLGNRRVSLRLALQSAGDALRALADSAHLQIGFDKDEKVVLSDAPPMPAKPAARRR